MSLILSVPAPIAEARGGDDAEGIRYAPPQAEATVRGREGALRFELGRRFELSLQVNNAFAAQNRRAVARAETLIAAIPGVRRVIGPSGLLAIALDSDGVATAGPLLGGGPGEDANEVVRQRLIRRSDAIGWFISRDGTEIRLLVETDDLPAVQAAIETTAASSGLVLLSGVAPAAPLWPEPDRRPRPVSPALLIALMLVVLAPGAVAVGVACRPTVPRGALATIAAGVAAAGPVMLAPAPGVRQLALWAACAAASLMAVAIAIGRAASGGGGAGRWRSRRLFVPMAILLPSVALVVAAVALAPRLSMATQLWRETSVFFVEVHGDMDEPVVLRELRRLTDFLRAEPGVAHAWSVADLFFAVPAAGEDFGGIPTSPEAVRGLLARARDDAAVRLELAPDHRDALVGVRFDDDAGVDRQTVIARLDDYFAREHRPALRRINVSDARLPPATRGLGRGILAADARERVLRICARSGRILSDSDVQTIERSERWAALVPVVDPPKLRAEIAAQVDGFLNQRIAAGGVSAASVPRGPARQHLIDVLAAQPADATSADVTAALREAEPRRSLEADLGLQAAELQRRLGEARRRHSARINFKDLLYGADLPTEGVLSEEVRDATLDAMGPIAAVPTALDAPGAFQVDAVAIGGAPNDRALSVAWLPRLMVGVLIAGLFIALLLEAIGGLAALAWLPAALAPGAPLIIVPAVASLPIGALSVAVLVGALAGGAGLAVACAPGRRDQ